MAKGSSFAWKRRISSVRSHSSAERIYVDACAAALVDGPGISMCFLSRTCSATYSDLAAELISGLGMAQSADIDDGHAVFQPCHA